MKFSAIFPPIFRDFSSRSFHFRRTVSRLPMSFSTFFAVVLRPKASCGIRFGMVPVGSGKNSRSFSVEVGAAGTSVAKPLPWKCPTRRVDRPRRVVRVAGCRGSFSRLPTATLVYEGNPPAVVSGLILRDGSSLSGSSLLVPVFFVRFLLCNYPVFCRCKSFRANLLRKINRALSAFPRYFL